MKDQHPKLFFENLSPLSLLEFRHQLTQELTVYSRPEEWRERRVMKVTPLNQNSCSHEISFQYKITPNIVIRVIEKLLSYPELDENDIGLIKSYLKKPSQLYGQRVTITLPLDQFPKNLRVGFSLKNSRGNTIPLLPRSDVSEIMASRLVHRIRKLFRNEEPLGYHARANKFTNNSYFMIRALTACFPGTIYNGCSKFKITKYRMPFSYQFRNEKKRYENLFNFRIPLTNGLISLDSPQSHRDWENTLRLILKFKKWLGRKGIFFPNGNIYLGINPLLWIREYFLDGEDEFASLKNPDTRPEAINNYLQDSRSFVWSLWKLLSPLDSNQIRKFFQMYTDEINHYIGFCEVQMVIGERMLVKMEETPRAKKTISGLGVFRLQQGCGISLGREQSWHLEIISPSFIELEIMKKKTYLQLLYGYGLKGIFAVNIFNPWIENKFHIKSTVRDLRVRRQKIFLDDIASAAEYSGERSHYYKSILGPEFYELLRRQEFGFDDYSQHPLRLRLWVKYKVHAPAILGNIFSFIAVLFCFGMLVLFVSNPEMLKNIKFDGDDSKSIGKTEFLALITVTVTVLISTMAIPERQRMTAPLIRWIRRLTVSMGIGVYGVLAGGLFILYLCSTNPSFCGWLLQILVGLKSLLIWLFFFLFILATRIIGWLY